MKYGSKHRVQKSWTSKKSTTYGKFSENIIKAITISNASKWVSIYFDYTEKSNGVALEI